MTSPPPPPNRDHDLTGHGWLLWPVLVELIAVLAAYGVFIWWMKS